ncbi:MAG: phosphohydrolase [Gammaproteobacteria bacterium]|uniref:HD-GYP domain-containing protein n=1 Tax=Rhodoferax sp. TaxID=50421 RepID=UPI001817759E|nr:HD domain-containing phosphohydrolase [Rhodoferax sp.]MBU3899774.1 phosphohydrolase [Gammaproteobacteria bacterium]MBA3057383.1 phosphohydrolase [Rhodoferax sp.]MBU3997040.1 phosphohydrolase [Gammaproteobacteria bacterium]MBU4019038.1 phosphohydrolase [Gammaproteobacteria bacterium]MBU4078757.1 phosphohydrolase [Gammaproteobacteria bacterium]
MKMLRLPRSKVQVGTPLPWSVRDAQGWLLLSRGHMVESEHQLDMLLQRGAYVDAEEVRAVARANAPEGPKAFVPPPNIFALWDQTTINLKKMLDSAGHPGDFAEQVAQFARHLSELLDYNPDIGIYRCVRQDNAQHFYYGYTHAVHSAVLCILLARHLQWPQARMLSLAKAALTMNLSILDLQGQMAAQDVPMKDKQRAAIHAHPAQCVERLEQLGVTDIDWLQAVAQHHERPDGTGYPLGSTEVCELAIALRVADVFMAKISPRVVREALSPQEAVRQLYVEDQGGPLSTAVIKELGIHPPGDFVRLASGELAIVVQRTANARAPIVASITDTAGHPVAHTVRRDTAQAEFAIQATASDKAMLKRLPPERLFGFSLAPPPAR